MQQSDHRRNDTRYEDVSYHSNEAGIPARILIRPRFGDFCYSKYEKELILEQIQAFREEGAQGVVIGALLPDGSFDLEFMEECMKAAGNCKVTCHRAFDMCRDPFEALEALINLGVDTLLTSGQEPSALAGANCLEALAAKSNYPEYGISGRCNYITNAE